MKSESGFSIAIASQPFLNITMSSGFGSKLLNSILSVSDTSTPEECKTKVRMVIKRMMMIRTMARSVFTFMSTPGECKTRIEKRFPTKPNIATIGIRVPCKWGF